MYVERYPVIKGAAHKRTTLSVAGRNGDLHYTENAFSNYQQPYECYFHDPMRSTPEMAHAVKAWLCSSGAYQRLEDSYDPQYFHRATYVGPLDVQNYLNRYGRCTVTFDCDPRAFLKSGEHSVTIADTGTIHNPTDFNALPLINVYGTGSGTIRVGDKYLVTIETVSDGMVIDCENHNAYLVAGDGTLENKNGDIYMRYTPELVPGNNAIMMSGGITHIEIIPRWWEL